MMKNRLRALAAILTLTIFFACFSGCSPNKTTAQKWVVKAETDGIEVSGVSVYQDGVQLTPNQDIDFTKDVKKIYQTEKNQIVFDYANGYSVGITNGLTPNYDFARYVCRYESDEAVVVISKENTEKYETMEDYFNGTLLSKLDDAVKTNNAITFDEIYRSRRLASGYYLDLWRASKTDMVQDYLASYSYLFIREKANSKSCYRILIKYKIGFRYMNLEKLIQSTFKIFDPIGRTVNNADYENPVVPDYWNDETKAYYNYLCTTDTTQWGLYNYQNYGSLQRENYYEDIVGTRADLSMSYTAMYTMNFDTEYAQKAYDQDKVTILTVRFEDSTGRRICYPFEIVAGKWDDQYKNLARQIKEFGHPVIIRMENEYNASWGVNADWALGDPDWYKNAWIHIYNIFRCVGVDNAIFMNCPQSNWGVYSGPSYCHEVLYIPSKEYIQIIGLTGYDMGSASEAYSAPFSTIYDYIQTNEYEFFGNWPWIIGEFGCGGAEVDIDKVKWITEMFDTVCNFPNIKGAIWFDATDSNPDGSLVHDFRLNSPSDAGVAFFEGIKRNKAKSVTGEWKFNH